MKRKREDEVETAAVLSVKQRRVQIKLKTEAAKVRHAFKVAKGFERQKLSKRRKNAADGKGEKGVDRIDAEIEALKTLDIDACAEHHFYKTLCKIKAITEHPDIPSGIKDFVKLPSEPATLDVNARLCNSNPVRLALDAGILTVQRALGLEVDDRKTLKKKQQRAKDFADDAAALKASNRDNQRPPVGTPRSSLEADGFDNSDNDALSDDDFDAYDSRIAASSDEGEDADIGVAELEQQLAREGVRDKPKQATSSTYDIRADLSLSDAESEPQSASPEPQKAPAVKRSSFIPTLTMGGYISGSGSDIEDIDVAPKKNRRGQRARQQIWEQKYGAQAKHLKRQDRNAGWDSKRGAVDGRGRPGQRRDGGRGAARRANPDYTAGGSKDAQPVPREKESRQREIDDRPIHPSWEAAKKAKERKEAPVAFQGKKITFD